MVKHKQKPSRFTPGFKPLTWSEHMFIGSEAKRVIAGWSQQFGWSPTVAKRNFTIYRSLEWLAAVLEDQLSETEGWFWCQVERICQKTGFSRPTVRSGIDALVEASFIEHERRWLPQSESQCSFFRLKIPPSCAGRVRRDRSDSLRRGLEKPEPGTEKSSTRWVKKFSTPTSSSKKREISKEIKAKALADIQEKCLRNGLDPHYWSSQVDEIVETAKRAETSIKRQQRKLRSAGVCDPLDVKLATQKAPL